MELRSKKFNEDKIKMIVLTGMLIITFLVIVFSAIYFTIRYKQREFQKQVNDYKTYYGYDTSKNWELLSSQKKLIKKINKQIEMIYPIIKGKETSQWGLRCSPFGKDVGGEINDFHEGLDISAARGTPVFAVADGFVEETKEYFNTGKTIRIYHGWISTIYGHLSQIMVKPNCSVKRGDLIGRVGSTGKYSTGNHLHFAIWNNIISNYQNPKLFLGNNK